MAWIAVTQVGAQVRIGAGGLCVIVAMAATAHRYAPALSRSPFVALLHPSSASLKERIIVKGATKSKSTMLNEDDVHKLRFGWRSQRASV